MAKNSKCSRCCSWLARYLCCCSPCCRCCCAERQEAIPLLTKGESKGELKSEIQEMEYRFMTESAASSEAPSDWESDRHSEVSEPGPHEIPNGDLQALSNGDLQAVSNGVTLRASPRHGGESSVSSSRGGTLVRGSTGRASWMLVPSDSEPEWGGIFKRPQESSDPEQQVNQGRDQSDQDHQSDHDRDHQSDQD